MHMVECSDVCVCVLHLQACKVDILRYCAGLATNTTTEPGKINECLRKSIDHLSEECRSVGIPIAMDTVLESTYA